MFNWMTFVSIVVVCGTDFTYSMKYRPFQNEETGHFGLKNRRNTPCLVLKFDAKLYIFDENYMNTTVQIPKLSSSNVKIHGYCAANDSRKQPAKISAVWLAGNSTKKLTLLFSAARMRSSVKQLSEVRWLLKSITLSSLDEGKITEKTSDEVIMSAPLKQKYVCRDKLNVTLKSNNQTSTILEMQPIIEAQPYNAAVTYANIYICDRTRRRTLAESFENKMTIFSGVVLGISSVSIFIGYSLRRQLKPSRQHSYQSLE